MKPDTLAEILWADEAASLRRMKKYLDKINANTKQRNILLNEDFLRYCEPWPEWVFNLAEEVLAVHFPSVSRLTFTSVLKNIHWLFFEAKIKGVSTTPPPLSLPPDFRNQFLRIIGHTTKLIEISSDKFSNIDKKQLPADLRLDVEKFVNKRPQTLEKLQKITLTYLEKRGGSVEQMGTIVDASRATLDSEGRIRETRATAIYQKILFSWPEVESLAGTKELCIFLEPLLDSNDALVNLERVKKIVQRMGIVFVPKLSRDIQGTS